MINENDEIRNVRFSRGKLMRGISPAVHSGKFPIKENYKVYFNRQDD